MIDPHKLRAWRGTAELYLTSSEHLGGTAMLLQRRILQLLDYVDELKSSSVESLYEDLKSSGEDGISHEDGWTLMSIDTANRLVGL